MSKRAKGRTKLRPKLQRRQRYRFFTRPAVQKLTLTKIDSAEAQLKAAIRLYFENGHLTPIYTLANAVRETVAQIGEHLGVETVQKEIARARVPLRRQPLIKRMIAAFPGLRGAPDRGEQRRIGLKIMEQALRDQSLEMAIKREVPSKPKSPKGAQ